MLLSSAAPVGAADAPAAPDGSRDFDFNAGVWKTQLTRKVRPLSGSDETIALNGTVTVRKVWQGRAQLEEIEADGPNGHWQSLTLFLYDPKARQWRQTFINSRNGRFEPGTLIGGFRDGRGELYATDRFEGRAILVRGTWSDIQPDAHRYEEAFSTDGGATWETVISARLTRLADEVPPQALAARADHGGSHAFDFDFGTWHTRSKRLLRPLTGSTEWVDLEGTTVVTPVWGGKANLAEFKADGPDGPLELLALRVYDPVAKQWSINFATPGSGALNDVPGIGVADANGRITFYDQESYGGRTILVRFSIWPTAQDSARSEQAFSADGGKTWETNWINTYSRE